MKNLRQISEGMSGYEAAHIIYDNDSKLYELINSCVNELEANKAYVELLNAGVSGGVAIEQRTGDDVTAVMSQAAVSNEISRIDNKLSETVGFVAPDIPESVHMPDCTRIANAEFATVASAVRIGDTNEPLSNMYYDVESLKETVRQLNEETRWLREELEKKN